MRARATWATALGLATTLGACTHEQTSFVVSLSFDDAGHHPTSLAIKVVLPDRTVDKPLPAMGGAIHNGDTFAVLLDDNLDGTRVTVEVSALGSGPPLVGQASGVVRRDAAVTVPVALGLASVDGGGDGSGAGADGGVADLLTDGGPRDEAPPDLLHLDGPPDLTPACTPGCANGIAVSCADGGAVSTPCEFGCGTDADGGAACVRPDNCKSPGDVSAGGVFMGSTTGYTDDATGSCGGAGGVDAVFSLTTNDWRTVLVSSAMTSYNAILYSRLTCGDPMSELSLAGPCVGANPAAVGTMCNNPNSPSAMLTLCNLPPGVPIYTWLDSKGLGGKYQLSLIEAAKPSSLNTCAEAGNLLDGNNRTFLATTAGHSNNFTYGLGGCGDSGSTSADAVFFLSVPTTRTYTFTTSQAAFKNLVYVQGGCNKTSLACGFGNSTSATLTVQLAPGLYYVVVDGFNNGSGGFALNVK